MYSVQTLSDCLEIPHMYLQASVEDPSDTVWHMAQFLIQENNGINTV